MSTFFLKKLPYNKLASNKTQTKQISSNFTRKNKGPIRNETH